MARSPRLALLGALTTSALLALVWLLAYHVPLAHRLDASILAGFTGLSDPRVDRIANAVAQLCNPQPFVWWAAAITLIAVLRRRPRTAVAVAVILAGSNVTTQLLKPALARPRFSDLLGLADQVGSVSWPSGHATASMSLALCAVMVAPARWRPRVAALGGVFVVAVVFSFLTLHWHYPSDVLGGFLMATTWTLVAVAALRWAESRWPQRASAATPPRVGEALAPAAVAALAAATLAAAMLLARPQQVVAYVSDHTAFVVGAGAIGTLALALASGLALMLRVPRRR
jgi:membrane-associated phospholipid phosphatase